MADLDYRWRLREVMAERGMFSTTEFRPLLAACGVELSPSQVYRLVVDKPERVEPPHADGVAGHPRLHDGRPDRGAVRPDRSP
jgi:hypothetical protein